MSAIEVKVPDIGDFKDIPVIEIFVKPGDTVKPEDSLVTLESDKATMDVPSPAGGVIKELKVKLGDKVSEGTVIAMLEAADAGRGRAGTGFRRRCCCADTERDRRAHRLLRTPKAAPAATAPIPGAATYTGKADIECQMLVLGAGPGGYTAAFRAADLGLKTVLVERYATLGGVCLNVGCIPSKALLHIAGVMDEAKVLGEHGISYGPPQIDLAKLLAWKNKVVGKLTGGLTGHGQGAQGRSRARLRHVPRSASRRGRRHRGHRPGADGREEGRQVRPGDHRRGFAVGEVAVRTRGPADRRFHRRARTADVPKKMLVIGGGIIGLEMGTVYSALGTRLDVVEMLDGLMQGADRDLVRVWDKMNKQRFDRVMLKTKTVGVEAKKDAIYVTFEGEQAPPGPQPYDLVLLSVGRTPNGKKIGADKAGIAVSDRGFIPVDNQMRTNVAHIFAIGDIVGQPMLAHKATHEGHVAAEVAAGQKSFFDARVIPSVAYTDPEVAWVGITEDEAKAKGIKVEQGPLPVGRVGPRDRQRPRRRLHQAAVRRRHASHRRRRHRRHARRRSHRRDRAGDRDGRRRRRHRQDHPSASDAVGVGGTRRGSVRRGVHGSAAGSAQVNSPNNHIDNEIAALRNFCASRTLQSSRPAFAGCSQVAPCMCSSRSSPRCSSRRRRRSCSPISTMPSISPTSNAAKRPSRPSAATIS